MLFTTYGGRYCSIFYMYHKNKIYSIVFLLILKGFFQRGGGVSNNQVSRACD